MPISLNTKEIIYLNLSKIGSLNDSRCEVEQSFSVPLLEKANQHLIAIERLEVPLHRIEFQPKRVNAFEIKAKDGSGSIFLDIKSSYSLAEFIINLNLLRRVEEDLIFYLDSSMRLSISSNLWVLHTIVLSDELREIFDFPANELIVEMSQAEFINNEKKTVQGRSSIIDRADQLMRVQIRTNLPTISEILTGDQRGNILTDLSTSADFNSSFTIDNEGTIQTKFNITDRVRQNLIYNSSGTHRYIKMNSPSEINNIVVSAVGVFRTYKDGGTENKNIILPQGGNFMIKLLFTKIK